MNGFRRAVVNTLVVFYLYLGPLNTPTARFEPAWE